jgi:hypothetical protein
MDEFLVTPLRNSSVAYLYQQRNQIELDPVYQRIGEIWTVDKKQLLIDSIINGFDIPKIYFHEFVIRREVDGHRLRYAIIDGKQRMKALWEFLADKYPLAPDFSYFEDENVKAGGMRYSDLADTYPDIAALFNATSLSVISIRTDDLELIEEMFSRLNEAVPLNAAEKRNAVGGPLPPKIRELAKHEFFLTKIPFPNTRYRHLDLAAKFIYWAHEGKVTDVKKVHLDSFFESMKAARGGTREADNAYGKASSTLTRMAQVFENRDPLLAQVGMVSVLYLFHLLDAEAGSHRNDLIRFETARRTNREVAEKGGASKFAFAEFDRLSQSPNDGSALNYRLRVLRDFLNDV